MRRGPHKTLQLNVSSMAVRQTRLVCDEGEAALALARWPSEEPLDGGRVLFSLLPPSAAHSYGRTEAYGLPILLLLLATGLLGVLVSPLIQLAGRLISNIFFL